MIDKSDKNISYQKVMDYLENPNADKSSLSPKEHEILKRWDYCYDQLKASKSYLQVVRRICDKFNVSVRTAKYDIQQVNLHFKPLSYIDIEWLENFIIEDAKKQIEVARNSPKPDHKAWEMARTTLLKIWLKKKDEEKIIDPELYGNNIYMSVFNIDGEQHQIDWDKLDQIPENKRLETREVLKAIMFNDIEDAEILEDDSET